ncbi:hypothetical protein MXD61_20980 [Frankia sp. AgPm24]|uniref:hypothetical protein n=1 Tax=Frankia sp. AgPm24 TaxID=631128 RepID=UPI00200FD4E6|nr:hypothetical protein [Frankia sp. AgPm24]MCK9924310.1 hypothetical protein [Frankia sp. AgPm24]
MPGSDDALERDAALGVTEPFGAGMTPEPTEEPEAEAALEDGNRGSRAFFASARAPDAEC